MGMLVNTSSRVRVLLRAEHVVGRNPTRCDTCLVDPDVSTIHAVVRFRDGRWSVADYSRNGTFLGGRALAHATWTPLRHGHRLCFGARGLSQWEVADISPPTTSLLPVDPELPPIALRRSTLLPSGQAPEVAIYQATNGQWLLEGERSSRKLCDGDAVSFAGQTYTLVVNCTMEETTRPQTGGLLQLSFRVSQDEEHVRLTVKQWPKTVDLGERSHHYCLLTLARCRAADARAGLEPETQGWVASAELARQLRIEPQHLNIQVFRARNQLMSSVPGAPPLASIVERRRGFLRLGAFSFDILRGDSPEVEYAPTPRVAPGRAAAHP